MSYEKVLVESREQAVRISQHLHGLRLKSDIRSKTAAACFAIAQQHHSSILILLSNKPALEATSMALLRLLLEATYRGLWISHCATDQQIENFISGNKKQVDMKSIIDALGKAYNDDKESASKLYTNTWKILSAYTHTYELQIQRWLTTNAIESNYQSDEITELLNRANDAIRLVDAGIRAIASE